MQLEDHTDQSLVYPLPNPDVKFMEPRAIRWEKLNALSLGFT